MEKDKLINVIVDELKVICDENGIDCSNVDGQTMLFGSGSIIDSLALVGLIVKVEEFVLDSTGNEIQIIDENTIITERQSPLQNVESLAELTLRRLYEE